MLHHNFGAHQVETPENGSHLDLLHQSIVNCLAKEVE